VPIVIPIAVAAGLDPVIPALAAVFGRVVRFMMPVSTPQNAVVYRLRHDPDNQDGALGHRLRHHRVILIVLLIPVMAVLTGLA
jgi:sodium-dependent dicarboxylate transporter 2/3/5